MSLSYTPFAAARIDGLMKNSATDGQSRAQADVADFRARAGDINLSAKLKPSRYASEDIIANDRDLLVALGLSDADASTYVQRSRQTLSNQLGAQKDGVAPDDYFKPGDLLMLVFAAARECPGFNEEVRTEVLAYIRKSRGGSGMSKQEKSAYDLVVQTLSTGGAVNLDEARGVIFLLPDFAGMDAAEPDVVGRLRNLAASVAERPERPWVLILSSNVYQAQAASDALGFKPGAAHTISHDHVEHYMPAVMIYRDNGQSDPFVITSTGDLMFAPQYRAPMMLACLKQMLPGNLRSELFSPVADNQIRAAS